MSSGTNANVFETRQALQGGLAADAAGGDGAGAELSERQMMLNRLWSYYRCMNYEGRKTDWNGKPHHAPLEHDVIATSGVIPPGFYDAAGQMTPLKFRRPTAPYYLAKVIVDRFTGLLFSAKRHPKVVVADDIATEDWLNGFVEATRLWAQMLMARTYGGAMGTVAMGFKFVEGRPVVEVHDPRWCSPEFEDRGELSLSAFEKLYQYPDTIRDPKSGKWVEGWYWYRRLITEELDVVWPKVPVGEEMPDWDDPQYRSIVTKHNFGFCPVVWVQNKPVQDDIDGDPDCLGVYDLIESIDALLSQANRGVVSNCDPTLHLATDGEMEGVSKGSDNALKTEAGGSASYLEITGVGPKAAVELSDNFEGKALRITRCVLDDNFAGPARTEEEVSQNYSNMTEQADVFREQYGERGIKRLLGMVLMAAKKLETPTIERADGGVARVVRSVIKLPRSKDGTERAVGMGEHIELQWPDWYPPSLDKVLQAVQAAGQAKQYGLVDDEHAVRFVADYFDIEDISAVVASAKAAQNAMTDAFVQQTEAAGEGGPPPFQPGRSPAGMGG